MEGISFRPFAHFMGQVSCAHCKTGPDALLSDDHVHDFFNGFNVAPGKIKPVKIVFVKDAFFNTFHGPANGFTAT